MMPMMLCAAHDARDAQRCCRRGERMMMPAQMFMRYAMRDDIL